MAMKKKTAETAMTIETEWSDLPASGWRIRRRADGQIQVQSVKGSSSLSLEREQWQEALEPLLFGGSAAD